MVTYAGQGRSAVAVFAKEGASCSPSLSDWQRNNVKKPSSHLKLHRQAETGTSEATGVTTAVETSRKGQLSRAFMAATGWNLRMEHDQLDESALWSMAMKGSSEGRPLHVSLSKNLTREGSENHWRADSPVSLEKAQGLAVVLAEILGENENLRSALRAREAELAAGVPIKVRDDEEQHLSLRLESVLQSGLQALGCKAGGLYLLDESTTQLKLRSAVGLSTDRLLAPARPLRGALADLEALVGHAVVLEDVALMPEWKCPENFAAAICVPVSSPTIPLGTLWFFHDEVRDFSDEQTNLVEIIAGRLAADLEREMLLVAGTETKQLDKQIENASRWQQVRLPNVTPMVDELDMAGWTSQRDALGGDFFDWTMLNDGRIAISVGDAEGKSLEASLSMASVQSAAKSHAAYTHTPAQLLERINETIWTSSVGDQFASFGYGLIDTQKGDVQLSLAGSVQALHVQGNALRGRKGQWLSGNCGPLGSDPDTRFPQLAIRLEVGEVLVLLSQGVLAGMKGIRASVMQSKVQQCVEGGARLSAKEIAGQVEALLRKEGSLAGDDQTVLVVKRRS